MKKYIRIFALALIVFTLSGCDLIPAETIEKTIEEICLENPDDELCTTDTIEDIIDTFEKDYLDSIDMFILDLENEELTDTEVCALWDGIDDDCDDIVDARMKFKAGAALSKTVNILDPDDDGDGILVGEISFTLDGHVTVLKISFDVDTTGTELKLMIKEIESNTMFVASDELTMKLEEFIKDYSDETLLDAAFYTKWFDQTTYASCGIDEEDNTKAPCPPSTPVRCSTTTDNCPIKYQFVLKTITPPGDDTDSPLYEAVFEAEQDTDGHVTLIKIAFDMNTTNTEFALVVRNIMFDDGSHNTEMIELAEIEALWNRFVTDYLDSSKTPEEINAMYFNGMVDPEFLENRVLDLENGLMITTMSIKYSHDMPDSFFDIDLDIKDGEEMYSTTIRIKVNRIDMALYMTFEDQDDMGEVSYETAMMVLDTYKKGYDHYVSMSNSVCAVTVVEYQVDECTEQRETMIGNGYMLVDYMLEMVEYGYVVEFTFEDADMNQMKETKLVFFHEFEDTYLLEFMDVFMNDIDNSEIDDFFDNFTKDVGDTSVLTTNVCHLLTGGGTDGEDNDCDGIVSMVRDDGYELAFGDIEDLGNDYMVEMIFTKDVERLSELYYFSFYYDEASVLKASIHLLDPKMDVYTDVYMLFADLNDFTIPLDKVCMTNVHEDSYDRCEAIRTFHETNGYFLGITEITVDDQMNITLLTSTYNNEGMEVEQNTFVLYYMTNADGDNPLYIESTQEGNNPLYN